MVQKVVSLYNFCQSYRGIQSSATKKQKQNFGRAIGSTENIIKRVFETNSFNPVYEYFDDRYKHPMAVDFLRGFLNICESYDAFFQQNYRMDEKLLIQTPGYHFDKLRIKYTRLLNPSEKRCSILAYGPAQDISGDLGILNCLYSNYYGYSFIDNLEQFEYWDLRNGEIQQIFSDQYAPVRLHQVRQAITRLVS